MDSLQFRMLSDRLLPSGRHGRAGQANRQRLDERLQKLHALRPLVLDAKPTFAQLAHNLIEDDPGIFNATPALDDGRIYLRSDQYLYCIGK
jgi:hypothetical protein